MVGLLPHTLLIDLTALSNLRTNYCALSLAGRVGWPAATGSVARVGDGVRGY